MRNIFLNNFLLFAVLSAAPASALYSGGDKVVNLTPSNFDKEVTNFDGVVFVEFYAPWCGHCKNLVPAYKQAARSTSGIVKFAALDADSHQSFASKFGIKGFPTIKIFGSNKRSPSDYNGDRSASGMVNAAMSEAKKLAMARLKGKSSTSGKSSKSGNAGKSRSSSGGKKGKVVKVTEANFEELVMQENRPVLVEFFAPWCGHCRNLEPEWKKAAERLGNKFVLAAVDATVEQSLASKYGVRGYPTIKYFKPGSKSPTDYNGGRTAEDIVAWAMGKLETDGVAQEVTELLSQDIFEEKCMTGDATNICFIAFLPDVLDTGAKGRNKYIAAVKGAMKSSRGLSFEYLWAPGGDQSKLEEAFNLPFGYPKLVAVHVEKKSFAVMVSAFDEKNISAFVNKIKTGQISTRKLSGDLPKLKKREAWDGKDGVMPSEDL